MDLFIKSAKSCKQEKLSKTQCQSIYPNGNDAFTFFDLEHKLGSRDKAEKLLVRCRYDFPAANEIATLCHSNFHFAENIIERFDEFSECHGVLAQLQFRSPEKRKNNVLCNSTRNSFSI